MFLVEESTAEVPTVDIDKLKGKEVLYPLLLWGCGHHERDSFFSQLGAFPCLCLPGVARISLLAPPFPLSSPSSLLNYFPEIVPSKYPLTFNPLGVVWPLENETAFVEREMGLCPRPSSWIQMMRGIQIEFLGG